MSTSDNANVQSADCKANGMSDRQRKALDQYLKSQFAKPLAGEGFIPRRTPGSSAPMSFSQRQVWLHGQIVGDIPLYNQAITIYRHGPLDVRVLERCLQEIVRRHEIWRTTFDSIGDEPVQIVHPAPDKFSLPVTDLSGLPLAEREGEAMRLATEDARRPIDLRSGPLFRALLVKMKDDEHCLYMTLHHLIFDAVTVYEVFVPELEILYEAFSAGKSSSLPETRLQYADFACWQREQVFSEAWSQHLSYWRRQLEGDLPVCQWPSDRARPAIDSHRGAIERFTLPEPLVKNLRAASQEAGVTLYMSLLAGFVAVLHRYTGQQEFVIGALTAGRDRGELEQVAGSFVNPLALRIDVGGNPTFRELQTRVREVLLGALTHGSIPFPDVVKLVQPNHDPSRHPLFQIAVSQQPGMQHRAPGWELMTEEISNGCAEMDFFMVMDDRGETVSGPITYNLDLFDAAAVQRTIGHWRTLLQAACDHPTGRVADLPLLTEEERRQFAEWNHTQAEYPRESCVHQLVEAQAARTPNAIAVEHRNERLTYRELDQRANQLAHFLSKHGVGPESRVGICLRRSLELPVAFLAVLKAGAACVPLDPAYPKERLAYMLEDSEASWVLTQRGLLAEVTDFDAEVITIDAGWHSFAKESNATLDTAVKPENLAYVIYTSGSTGKPRGVLLTHGGLVNHNTAAVKLFDITPADRMAQFASISFDIAIEEIFPTWIAGGALVIREEDASLAVGDFLRWVRDKKVTALDLPTSYWHELVAELSESSLSLPQSLRMVIVGGEKASSAALAAWHKLAGSRVRWVNTYGPTETSVIVTSFEPTNWENIPSVLPIGRPIANTKIYILDQNLQPVPVGIPGDLYVSGPGLARGYLNRPEVTAEKFVRDPFSSDPNARIYKTGDLARYLPNGEIEFAGRTDDQVKIRGYRVELKEIESVLGSHSGVREVAVIARENEAGEKSLIAYVVPSREQTPTGAELRTYLKQKLPNYMVPAAFVLLEAMPKTPNGKVNRRGMPAPKPADFAEANEYVAPTDELEANLARIWGAVLSKEKIGIRDNFFDLGGHSLLAARLMHRIEQAYGQRIPLAALLQAPTIEQFSVLLRTEGSSSSWSLLVPIQAEGSRPPFFCVHGVGGNVVGFRDLTRHMEPDQPFYALQPQGLDGKRPCLSSVTEMAEQYVREIRRVQPQGPYRIGGYSFGGLVAYEMAQRLQADGEEVALLALFDTYPGKMESRTSQLRNLSKLSLKDAATFIVKKGSFVLMTLRKRLELQMLPKPLRNVRQACAKAAGDYDVLPYDGQVTLFRVKEKSVGSLNDPYAIWWRVAAGGVDLREISGDHLSLLKEPQVRFLAEELTRALENSSSDESSLLAAVNLRGAGEVEMQQR